MGTALIGHMPNGFSCSDWLTAAPASFPSGVVSLHEQKPIRLSWFPAGVGAEVEGCMKSQPSICFHSCRWLDADKVANSWYLITVTGEGTRRENNIRQKTGNYTNTDLEQRKPNSRMLHKHEKAENHQHPRVDNGGTPAGGTAKNTREAVKRCK